MSDLNSSRQPRHGIRSRVLLGTAAAALVVGGLAGGAVMDVRTPAYAEPVRVQSQAQLPNFADLVDTPVAAVANEMPVRLVWREYDGVTLPQFVPATAGEPDA